jgi:hypothetical protein
MTHEYSTTLITVTPAAPAAPTTTSSSTPSASPVSTSRLASKPSTSVTLDEAVDPHTLPPITFAGRKHAFSTMSELEKSNNFSLANLCCQFWRCICCACCGCLRCICGEAKESKVVPVTAPKP